MDGAINGRKSRNYLNPDLTWKGYVKEITADPALSQSWLRWRIVCWGCVVRSGFNCVKGSTGHVHMCPRLLGF